jgi:hypothetical protein
MDVTNLSRTTVHATMGVSGGSATVSQQKNSDGKAPEQIPGGDQSPPKLNSVVAIDPSTNETILKVKEGAEEFQIPSKLTLEYERHERPKEST